MSRFGTLLRTMASFSLFTLTTCVISSCEVNLENTNTPKAIVIEYIQKDTMDLSLNNIRALAEVGKYFTNTNYAILNPHDGYLSYLAVNQVVFNPKIDFNKAAEYGYLLEDRERGLLQDYTMVFELDSNARIIKRRSFLKFSKAGKLSFSNDSVPDIRDFLDLKLITKKKDEFLENQRLENEVNAQRAQLDQWDNSEFWEEFDPIVKKRIYDLVQEKNCSGLQEEFDIAAESMSQRQRRGLSAEGNLQLMNFVDLMMRRTGCYN